jgi:hypothetical protein
MLRLHIGSLGNPRSKRSLWLALGALLTVAWAAGTGCSQSNREYHTNPDDPGDQDSLGGSAPSDPGQEPGRWDSSRWNGSRFAP